MNDIPESGLVPYKRSIQFAGLWIVLVLFDVQFSFGFFDSPAMLVLLFGVGVGVAFFLAGIPYGIVKKSPRLMIEGAGVVLFMLSATMVAGVVMDVQKDQSMAMGDRVAPALEAYRSERGGYPDTLSELAPEYLEAVPTSRMGLLIRWPFTYESQPGGRYALHFDAGFGITCGRVPDLTEWNCHD